MTDKEIVREIVAEGLQGTDCFIVDVIVRTGNNIVVEIDNQEGIDIERCEKLHRFIESKLDREVEDYDLEVGSAGITSPFKVIEQYRKNVGNEGTLKSCDEQGFVLSIIKKVKPEGAKRKIEVEEEIPLAYDEVKYTKYLIRFK